MTVGELVGAIDADRQHANLSSAIRLFVLGVYRDQVASRQDRTQRRCLMQWRARPKELVRAPVSPDRIAPGALLAATKSPPIPLGCPKNTLRACR